MELFLVGPVDHCRGMICRTVLHSLTIDVDVHQVIRPIDFLYQSWGNEHLLPWPPVLRIDHQVVNALVGILNEEVVDVANLAVARMNIVPGDRFDAAKMRIVVTSIGGGNVFRATTGSLQRQRRHGAAPVTKTETVTTHVKARTPVWAPTIVIVDIGLYLPRHGTIGIDIRAVLDLLLGQSNRKFAALGIDVPQCEGR